MAEKKRKKPAGKKEPSPAKEPLPTKPKLAVVGMGASAGGLEAFKNFFEAMPADSGLAFVLIQHLDPTHESMMAELLARHTSMQVAQVDQQTSLQANHVYIAPANKYLTIRQGVLYLTEPTERRGMRMPIDSFLRSLAAELQERAIGIILSGTGTEGTLGLRAIKEHGGMAMVQEPQTAGYDNMPRSAIATGLVDYVLPVEKMAQALVGYVRHPYVKNHGENRPLVEKAPDHLNTILALLRAHAKQDFRSYKKNTLMRRIERRMGLNHIEKVQDYIESLRRNPAEMNQLFKDLLIGVTGFFRELEAWEALRKEAVTALLHHCTADRPLRVWVPGCSTGEEAYSLGMVLLEQAAAMHKNCTLQIFATDIDEDALEFARTGIYPESITADVPPERLRHFFTKVDGHNYQVNKQLREPVVFAVQNLIGNAPFSKLDLISCRNLLIYLEPAVQEKIISLFHFGLKPGGYLFLGSSESIGRRNDLFETISKKWQIHRRIGQTQHMRIDFPIVAGERRREPVLPAEPRSPRPPSLAEITQQALLQEYAPASLLVNRRFEILYFFGPTSRYLDLPTGAPTLDLLTLSQEELRPKLRGALHEASQKEQPAAVRRARIKRNGKDQAVTVAVKPIKVSPQGESLLLVTFVDEPEPSPAGPAAEPAAPGDEALVHQLETELKTTREELHTTIEELETSNEELKVTNEEIMSMNEEFQSTNEELETSKEELQSLNEELSTVNSQLQEKVQELETTGNDLNNLLSSTEMATIFLSIDLRIKRFTPVTTQLLNLIPTDVGRPFSDIASRFADNSLLGDAKAVLEKLAAREKEVQTANGQWYLRRIMPYRTQDNKIEGVVITFTDVTPAKRAEEQLKSLNDTLEQRVAARTSSVKVLQEVAVAANEADDVQDVIRWTLRRICEHDSWCLAIGYLVGTDGKLELVGFWHGDGPTDYSAFIAATKALRAGPMQGLPEWIIQSGQPAWIEDLEHDHRFLQGPEAAALGLRAAFLFPILVGKEGAGVLEFFAEKAAQPEAGLVEVMASIALQLGRVVERHRRQRELAERIWSEQGRLGQELHDTVGQELTGLGMMAKSLQRLLEYQNSLAADKAGQIADGLHTVTGHVREIARGLFPVAVDAEGLAAALAELTQRIQERHGVTCTFAGDGKTVVTDNTMATHVYHIAQEAVTNAIKHGKAKNITVALESKDSELMLRVSNDGIPFQTDLAVPAGLGLRSMLYRASLIGGTVEIQANDGRTEVTFSHKK